jgi:hypothetical protein
MTATTIPGRQTVSSDEAARRLYQAELALHDAHATHDDRWIAAAADRLHEALEVYLAAKAAAPPA